jgi:hypothetical protein
MDKGMWDKLMNTNWWEKFVKFLFEGLRKILVLVSNLIFRIQAYVHSGEWTKQHISFVKEGNKIRFVVKSHDDFVDEVEIEIAKYKGKRWGKKFIKFVLEQALSGCNFVLIESDNVFVQFWTGRSRLEMDIPLVKGNGLRKYYYTVIGLLTDMNYFKYPFTRTGIPTILKVPEHFTFRVDEEEGFTKVIGYFDKRTDQAVEFVDRLFREVYEVKNKVLEIKVG